MNNISTHLKKMDWIMIVAAVLLVCFGLLSIYSSSLGRGDFSNFTKQAIFAIIGIIIMFFLSFLDWRAIKNDPYFIVGLYVLSLASLAGLLFFAPEIRGAKSWYKIGPISLDPIEFAKIVLIALLAKYFSTRHVEMYRIGHIFSSGAYVLLVSILVLLQPDLGSVLVILAIWLGILIISGIKIRHFLALSALALVIFAFSWSSLLKDYQKERILNVVNPSVSDDLKTGWNQRQAKIAIGSGGLLGEGIAKGSQTQHGFLPEAQTDFVFSSLAEETGLAGIAVLFLLLLTLVWRIIKISLTSQSNFPRLFASGIAILIVFQTFINIGMNLGILPVIGLPLPLVSYGGSSLVAAFIALGILQSIKTH